MFKRMTPERREEIRAALEPLPAYPWKWDGDDVSGPFLASGDDYPSPLLSSIKGDALLFYGYNEDDETERLSTPQHLAEQGLRNVVGDWIESGAQYAEELLFDNERLTRELKTAHAVRIPVDTLRPLIDPTVHTEARIHAYLKANGFKPTSALYIWGRGAALILAPTEGDGHEWTSNVAYFARNLSDEIGIGELGVLAGIAAASGMDGAQ
jgi:hypothetical protein